MFLLCKIPSTQTAMCLELGTDLKAAESLVLMFETNAKFVNTGWSAPEILEVDTTIHLGDKLLFKSNHSEEDREIIIQSKSKQPDLGWVEANPVVLANAQELQEKHTRRIGALNSTIDALRAKIKGYQREIERMEAHFEEQEISTQGFIFNHPE